MTISNYDEYMADKKAFFNKYNNDFEVQTSQMDSYGSYSKTYIFSDNAIWYEVMTPTYEQATVEIKKVMVKVEVKMLRTEYFSTDDAHSKYYYEKF